MMMSNRGFLATYNFFIRKRNGKNGGKKKVMSEQNYSTYLGEFWTRSKQLIKEHWWFNPIELLLGLNKQNYFYCKQLL
jgi:hypothetical protein